MRTTRIYHQGDLILGKTTILNKAASHHLLRVLRLTIGTEIRIFDGKGNEALTNITTVCKNRVHVVIEKLLANHVESPLSVHVGQAILRNEKMDFVLQKAVELGVTHITPVLTQLVSVKIPPEKYEKRFARWSNIIIAACEQCGRNVLPELSQPLLLTHWLEKCKEMLKIVWSPDGDKRLADFMNQPKSVALLVGPEGGLAEEEIQLSKHYGFESCRLGPRVLRTETMALAAVAALQSHFGDLA